MKLSLKKLIRNHLLLILIISLAVILRFVKLGSIPIGFNDDEAAFGYNAYSIIKTGKDEWGRILPFPVFESFGDWKLVGYLYLTVLSQLIFGVNEFATRLPSAFLGVAAVIGAYLLTKELFRDSNLKSEVAHLGAFLLAISPWHIIASRNAFESDILIFPITISLYFFLRGIREEKFFLPSFFGFAICFYIYRSAWLFVPAFITLLIFWHRVQLAKTKKALAKSLIVFFILVSPLLPVVATFKGQSRFLQESFVFGVSRIGIINEINEKRGACFERISLPICQILYNKYLSFVTVYFNNYFENLSPQTYFTHGSAQGYQSLANRGLFYTFELPLLVIGLITLITQKNPAAKVLISWILLVPIGASFTGVGNPGRLNILMPAPQIIAAFGLISLLKILGKPLFKGIILSLATLLIIISISRFWADMFYDYPLISGRYQRYGYKQLFNYLESQKESYVQIAVSRKTDDAKQYIHYLFFEKYSPAKFLDSQLRAGFKRENGWRVVEQIGNFQFYPSTPRLNDLPPKTLLAVGEKEVIFPDQPPFIVNYLNGDRAFEVYDIDQVKARIAELEER